MGSALTTICLIAGTDALVTGLRRPISRCSCAARAGVRLQLFPGDDPWEFVRQNARRRAAEHMAMEEAERGEPLSHAYKAAYADLLVDLEVKDAMAGKDRETGWRASDAVPAASLPPPKAAAPGDGGGSTATAAAAPTSRSAREQVLQALADSRGMWVDTDAKTEVWQSLPSSLQQAFASQKIALVELALKLLLDEVGEQELERLMQRCLEARFWDKPEDFIA